MTITLNFSAIRRQVKTYRDQEVATLKAAGKTARTTRRGEVLETRAMAYLRKVVAPQLETGFGLTLQDTYAAEILGCSPREAKRAKDLLSSMGVIICPQRPKRAKQWVKWLVPQKFLTFPETSKRQKKTKSSLKYVPGYYRLRSDLWREQVAYNREMGWEMTLEELSVVVAITMKELLERQGMTKEDFLRAPYQGKATLAPVLPGLIVI